MDLVYMPEALSYGSLRHPQYRDYEQPWNKDYFNYGKSTTKTKNQQRQQLQKSTSKVPCSLCKENKRRTLAAYIRGKARSNSCSEIHEEIEEDAIREEEEEEDEEGEEKEEVPRCGDDEESREKSVEKPKDEAKTSRRRSDENIGGSENGN
ncbi:X-linked retinitis pigmentosa GTPase regulator-interacting protein 1-like [Diprion similis]|uniref:X-linked retinitis pigmentosa GTPase regulator-interacting protein 1-like n=1 Tax=Diprion similis TaxID=362088 RepID=UPI001EF82C53|nr:X-linked retinitis pigmentosa GTPase regulator-interacting protein 1-like [Diprion similis]